MYILNIGVNHQTTPIEIREKITFSEYIELANEKLSQYSNIRESVILSTCNRTEIYVVSDCIDSGYLSVKNFLLDWFDLSSEEIAPYLVVHAGTDAIRHLLQVITGLHSMVLGETQILGQIREAYLTSLKLNTTGKIFNEIFQRAIAFAKKAHAQTGIGEHTVSISYAAVELLNQSIVNLSEKRIVVVGAGEMSELAIRNLISLGCQNITIVNRTYERANKLANEFYVKAEAIEHLSNVLLETDIVLLATSSPTPVLSKSDIEEIQTKRNYFPITFVDIGLPRNVEETINEIENVRVYNIDALQSVVDANLQARQKAAEKVEAMIEEEIASIKEWIKQLGARPIITALHKKGEEIHQEIYTNILRKMPDLTYCEKNLLYFQTRRIVRRLLHEPIICAKQLSKDNQLINSLQWFMKAFNFEEEHKEKVEQHINYYETLLQTEIKESTD